MERILRMATNLVKLINPFSLIYFVNDKISGMRFQIHHCDHLGGMIVTMAMPLSIFMPIMRIRR